MRVLSLRSRLMLLVLLTLVPAIFLMALSAVEQRRDSLERVAESSRRLLSPVSTQVAFRLEDAQQLLMVLAHSPEVRNPHGKACSALLGELLDGNPLYRNLGVIDARGDVQCSAVRLPGPLNLSHRDYFQHALRGRKLAIGAFQIGRITGKPGVNLGYPLLDEHGRATAVVFAALDLSWLAQFVEQPTLPGGSMLDLLDRRGHVLAHYPRGSAWLGRDLHDAVQLKALAAPQEATGEDGVRRLYVTTPVAGESAFVSIGLPLETAYASINRALWRNVLTMGLVGLAVALLAWMGSDWLILRRARALAYAAERLSRGELSARTGLRPSTDELGQVSRAFDEMAQALQASTETQKHAAEVIARREAELAQARELDRMKSNFVNAVTHELRTPLTSIKGFAEFLEDGIGGELSPQQAEYVQQIVAGSERLQRLVNDLLDFARMDAGTFQLRMQPSEFNQNVRAVVESLRPLADDKGLQLHVALEPNEQVLSMDALRIQQVLTNLLSNAIKFTPAGGAVWVRSRVEGPWLRCEVSDTGPGIPLGDHERLFERFVQLENGINGSGTGLGLSIAKALVAAHGGQIGLESTPGLGATFWFTLPLQGGQPCDETQVVLQAPPDA